MRWLQKFKWKRRLRLAAKRAMDAPERAGQGGPSGEEAVSAEAVTTPTPRDLPQRKKPHVSLRPRTTMTEGVIWRQLLLFTLPILLSNLFQQLYNMVDLLIVGRYEGKLALGAIASTGSITTLLTGLFIGISAGASVVVSQHYGADNTRSVQDSVHTAMAFALVTGSVMTLMGYILAPPILAAMDTPADIIDQSVTYMRIIFLGMLPTMVYNMGAGILRAIGDSRRPLLFLIISSLINLSLDLLFVKRLGWGVAGAAGATFFAQVIAAVLVVVTLMRSEDSYRLRPKKLKIHGYITLSILKIGLPAGAQSVVINISNVIIQSQINAFGSGAVAGAGAAGRIDGFLYMTINAFGIAVMTFVGQNHGAGRIDRAKKSGKIGLMMAAASALLLGVLVVLFRNPLLSLFNDEPEVLRYGGTMLLCLAPAYWILSAGEVYSGFLRGVGSALYPMLSSLICMSALRLGFIFVGRQIHDSILVVFLSYPFSWILQAISMLVYVKLGRWHRKDGPRGPRNEPPEGRAGRKGPTKYVSDAIKGESA